MCGIAGALRFGEPVPRDWVQRMVESLHHRGPDGQHIESWSAGAMGCARLAIVDPAGGQQPLWSPGGRICLAMNGEVYNHRALRRELEARELGPLRTESDTEVAALLMEDLPAEKALLRLEGMFGIAAWDAQQQRLHLARDRSGQKDLYWTLREDGTFLFGSELKALLSVPGTTRRIRSEALSAYLLMEYIPAPWTIYEGIHKLLPGHRLEFDAEGVRVRRWWQPPLPGQDAPSGAMERYALGADRALQIAVKRRMADPLPLACLLSGGIDSSAVAVWAARRSQEPLHSFAAVFEESSFDESAPAARVAAHLGTVHHEVKVGSSILGESLAHFQRQLCEPLGDGSLPSTWALCRAVRATGFKVALTGDGADEHFGGYPTYLAHRLARPLRPLQPLLSSLARRLPASTENLSLGFKARRMVAGLSQPWARRNQIWLGAFLPEDLRACGLQPEQAWSPVEDHARELETLRDPALRAMALDQRLYLAEGVLRKADRASMLSGLELRSPFLDSSMQVLAAGLPPGSWISPSGQTKVLLRRAFRDALPPDILQRPKKGFGTPIGPWLRGSCQELLEDLPDRLEPWLPPEQVRAWCESHRRGERDQRRRLWTLLILSRWLEGPWGPRGA